MRWFPRSRGLFWYPDIVRCIQDVGELIDQNAGPHTTLNKVYFHGYTAWTVVIARPCSHKDSHDVADEPLFRNDQTVDMMSVADQ